MALYKVIFGKHENARWREQEDLAKTYLGTLYRNGQAIEDHAFSIEDGKLCSYVELIGSGGHLRRNHSAWGRRELANLRKLFGQETVWERKDETRVWKDATWKSAEFLVLFAAFFDRRSPLKEGVEGRQIPLYRVPVPYQVREDTFRWPNYATGYGCRADRLRFQHTARWPTLLAS